MEIIKTAITKRVMALREKLSAIKADPEKICLGYALGIFIATTPFIGLKALIAILLTSLLGWNKIASVIAVFHINILTGPLFYGFAYIVGHTVLNQNSSYILPDHFTMKTCMELFTDHSIVFFDLLAGGTILGLPMALAAYFFSHRIICRKQ